MTAPPAPTAHVCAAPAESVRWLACTIVVHTACVGPGDGLGVLILNDGVWVAVGMLHVGARYDVFELLMSVMKTQNTSTSRGPRGSKPMPSYVMPQQVSPKATQTAWASNNAANQHRPG